MLSMSLHERGLLIRGIQKPVAPGMRQIPNERIPTFLPLGRRSFTKINDNGYKLPELPSSLNCHLLVGSVPAMPP